LSKASKVLTLNRNKIKSEYYKHLKKDFLESSLKLVTENFEQIFITDEGKWLGSMFINYYSMDKKLQHFNTGNFKHWENLDIKFSNSSKSMTIFNILNFITTLRIVYTENMINFFDRYELIDKELKISFANRSYYDFSRFFLLKAKEHFTSFTTINPTEPNVTKEVVLSKGEQGSPIPDENILDIIKQLLGRAYSARSIIPCIKEFFILRIKNDAHAGYVYFYGLNNDFDLPFPKMLSPFISQRNPDDKSYLMEKVNDKLIDWVYENRFDKATTKEQIIEGYKAFCQKINLEEINKESPPSG
jgi:hypothetical protein